MLKFFAWPSVAPMSQKRDSGLEEAHPVLGRFIAPAQDIHNFGNARAALILIFTYWWYRRRLAQILLGLLEKAPILRPDSVKALDHQHFLIGKACNLGTGNAQPKRFH